MISIFCHLYHHHLWGELSSHFQSIKTPKKLYVNLVNDNQHLKEMEVIIKTKFPDATVLFSPNQGRDCGGNLRLAGKWLEEGAPGDYIIQCHTKSDDGWRAELLHPLFSFPENIPYLFKDARVGMVGSNRWLYTRWYDVNRGLYDMYRSEFGFFGHNAMNFIAGTIFCVRASIYKEFFSKHDPVALANQLEPGGIQEPSRTHTWERLFGGIVTSMGYTLKPVDFSKKVMDLFDEQFYLESYPDVKATISHKFYSAFSHFIQHGRFEGRKINRMTFDESYYLENNPDIHEAVSAGRISSGYVHWLLHGHAEEHRKFLWIQDDSTDIKVFDINHYLETYQDVANNWSGTAEEHYAKHGQQEGRKANWLVKCKVEKPSYKVEKSSSQRSLCVFSHFSTESTLPKYVEKYLIELSRHFDEVALVSNQKVQTPWNLMVVENEGLDFGMWKKKLNRIDPDKYTKIALVNDSGILFGELDKIFNWAENNRLDYWGLTDSHEKISINDLYRIWPEKVPVWQSILQNPYHIQSYFMVFEKLAVPHLLEFFTNYQIHRTSPERLRAATVIEGEVNISGTMLKNGLNIGSYMKVQDFSQDLENTNLHVKYWKQLIERGLPMIKKKIINGEFSRLVPNMDFSNWHLPIQQKMKWKYDEVFD